MLLSPCYAHSIRPRRFQLGLSVSRHELWFSACPFVGDLAAMPGALVRAHGSYGIYVKPDFDRGSLRFKLESRCFEVALHRDRNFTL